MNPLEQAVRAVDRFQQHNRVAGFIFGVQKKVGDDNAGQLISNLAYSAFITVFPLLLLLVTLLGALIGSNAAIAKSVEHSVFAQFPILGNELQTNIRALHRSSPFALVAGILGLIWGATGLAQTGLYAMAQVWNIPGLHRPNFWKRLGRSLLFLVALGISVTVSGFLSGFGTVGSHDFVLVAASELASVLVNTISFLVAFRILTPHQIATKKLLPGAIVGAVAWTIVEAAGGYLLAHNLKHASQVYGFFAYVLGLVAYLYIGARIAIYAAETNAVLAYRLWPRSIVQPPFTEADRRALELQVIESARRPEQIVSVSFNDTEDHRQPDPTG